MQSYSDGFLLEPDPGANQGIQYVNNLSTNCHWFEYIL
jgi:hypothetical protein